MLLTKLNRLADEIDIESLFSGESATLFLEGDFDEQYDNQVDIILKRLNEFVRNGSGTVESVVNLSVRIVAYKPTSGSSYIKLDLLRGEICSTNHKLFCNNNNNNKHFFNLHVANSPSRLRFETNLSRESSECTEHS